MQAGLTLLEVLIAITLVSLLATGMLWAMRVGLGAMNKANDKLMANRRVTGAQRVLEQQISGLMPVTARMRGNGQFPGAKVPFFQGEPQSMRFVTSYSLQEASRGVPRVVEFQVIPGENGHGVRLIVNEWPYTGPDSTGAFIQARLPDPETGGIATVFQPIESGPQSFVLADRLADCRFSFQEIKPPPDYQRWDQHWVWDNWPSAIRIEMSPLEPDSGRLQMITITSPVHVTRLALEQYEDLQ